MLPARQNANTFFAAQPRTTSTGETLTSQSTLSMLSRCGSAETATHVGKTLKRQLQWVLWQEHSELDMLL